MRDITNQVGGYEGYGGVSGTAKLGGYGYQQGNTSGMDMEEEYPGSNE